MFYMHRHSKNVELFQASQAAKAIFQHYDVDHNGYLDYEEALSFLNEILSGQGDGQNNADKLL
jgi:Ca2+-binding EF-hand superfamily protein